MIKAPPYYVQNNRYNLLKLLVSTVNLRKLIKLINLYTKKISQKLNKRIISKNVHLTIERVTEHIINMKKQKILIPKKKIAFGELLNSDFSFLFIVTTSSLELTVEKIFSNVPTNIFFLVKNFVCFVFNNIIAFSISLILSFFDTIFF